MSQELINRIGDIEDAIIRRLIRKDLAVNETSIEDAAKSLVSPAANVALWSGDFSRVTFTTYRFDGSFVLTLVFKNPRSEKGRRRGVYPLMMAASQYLAEWKPTDKDDNALPAKPFTLGQVRKVLDQDGKIAFTLQLKTSFNVEVLDEETLDEFTQIALEYYLQPDDETEDASDILDMST